MRQLREQLALCVLPVLALGIALAAWFARIFDPSGSKYASDMGLEWLCLFGIATLGLLVLFGMSYFVRRPLAGAVTSFCLLALFSIQNTVSYPTWLGLPVTIVSLGIGSVSLLVYLAALLIAMNRRSPASLLRCRKCGYNLRGNQSGQCPECGTMLKPRQQRLVEDVASESGEIQG